MKPNYDPRDDTDVRPQVGFRLRARSDDYDEFSTALAQRFPGYHDILVFDAVDGEQPGVVRFPWDTPATVVDSAAEWLRSIPHVFEVVPVYGGPV